MGPTQPFRLTPDPDKFLGALGVTAGVAASAPLFAVFMRPLAGLIVVGLCGLFALYFALALRPDWLHLELTPDGLAEQVFLTRHTWRWHEFDAFLVVRDAEHRVRVAFRCSDRDQGGLGTRPARSTAGSEGVLFETYGMTPDALADLLNRWRLRYGSKPPAEKELLDDWV